jgi:GT2 family glycosyltransferase/glycosyltransferase involved in cell wall biosynthesis
MPSRHLFSPQRRPYYIYAPPYRRTSAGIKVLHLLCHALNEIGEEAYVTTDVTDQRLRTPELNDAIKERHKKLNIEPITVYPEITNGNPLEGKLVVRYIMNIIGLLGGPKEYPQSDLILAHSIDIIPEGMSYLPLFLPTVDDSIFHNKKNPDHKKRKGKLIYPGRFSEALKVHPELLEDSTIITGSWPETHQHLAELMRKSSVLYCFTYSAISLEAILCGCPVVFMPSPYNKKFFGESELGKGGYTFENKPEAISLARKTLNQPRKAYVKSQKKFWIDLKNFVDVTQSIPVETEGKNHRLETINLNYKKWLVSRSFIETDTKFLFNQEDPLTAPQKFNIIIRLPEGSEHLLADTLDSLNQQVSSDYHLDIFTTLPSPEGFGEIQTVDWHTLDSQVETKDAIDFIVRTRKLDWIIELPAGARLDILFLWRLAYEIRNTPEAAAFFVDDDCCDGTGERFDPRFKPGVNIEALRSADLAGPICARADTWLASDGASQRAGSPWFEKLLKIADKTGWGSIKHIPDILITYLNQFPSDFESCQLALSDSLKAKGIEGEIINVTSQSWGIRYSLKAPPAVTVAILSTGQFELAKRCLSSVLKSTHYSNYEILIITNKIHGDPDFDNWLTDIQTQSEPQKVRVVYVSSDANYATRCNAAIASSENELVVLSKEETVFVQDIWLEELVAALQQTDISAVAPLIHQPGDAKILASGQILGLLGEYGSPHAGKVSLGEAGYLDCLQISKDTVAFSSACFLIRKAAYQTFGGMDEIKLGDDFADIDLCLKLHHNHHRLIVHPRASVVYGFDSSQFDFKQRAEATVKKLTASEALHQRWGSDSVVDPYWNINLSTSNATPQPETEYRALWQYLPSDKPRFLAHAVGNGQGDFRITRPLNAIRKAGLASECVWRQISKGPARYFSAAEICRLEPTTVIVQNYIHDISLAVLKEWGTLKTRPFVIYTLDDLINDLDKTNPFRKNIPPNARSRFKYALSNCDRLVLSTEFLADTYRHFIDDIKVVPNRLEKDIWLPLNSKKQTSQKPRIGWAGGTTHEGDLILLKEIIEQTREEADWVFFGMCPEAIRPLLAEFHELVSMDEYPGYLASLNLDIAVAPLAMTPFNQGKSNLRLLEYGALGVPVVCTDIDPYQNSPACRVKNSADAWVAALRERIYDVDAREKEGIAMRDWMYRSYLLEDHLDEWLSAHLPG